MQLTETLPCITNRARRELWRVIFSMVDIYLRKESFVHSFCAMHELLAREVQSGVLLVVMESARLWSV